MGCSLLNNYNQHNDVVIPQLGPHWPLISCVLSSLGRLGPARAEVGLSFAVVGWFRRFCLPPLRWFCSVSVGLRFSFLLPFQGLPASGPGVLVLVFSSYLFFCVLLLVSWSSIFHFIFMFISFSFPLHPHLHFICQDFTLPRAGCVCVCVFV